MLDEGDAFLPEKGNSGRRSEVEQIVRSSKSVDMIGPFMSEKSGCCSENSTQLGGSNVNRADSDVFVAQYLQRPKRI